MIDCHAANGVFADHPIVEAALEEVTLELVEPCADRHGTDVLLESVFEITVVCEFVHFRFVLDALI